ncbi:hypothetical protein GRX03_11500 [Halovenus sp. WSH3]|uniref:DUF7310 domain-containing protein n=1 Tax=Halovenus carboxidivorans TaxID=2692199 RepID=A0A6B0T2D2_9EURY|nr:hypothetical protein [Halovenus carboxidivorans]MXR52224.1 hypothetical protein [Halovenus carboxidivorans]
MDDALTERVEALERTVAEGEFDQELAGDYADIQDTLSTITERLDDLEEQVDEIDAAAQALRGYVGNVRSVNEDVERRADAALAKAEALESSFETLEAGGVPEAQAGDEIEARAGEPTKAGGDEQPTERTHAAERGRCHECGRRHGARSHQQSSGDVTRPEATDGGRSPSRSEQQTDPSLLPEESDGTGRLQRIRELL